MRSLADLTGCVAGRRFLVERGVYTDTDDFIARVAPPRRAGLVDLLELPAQSRPVYTGHQLLADYQPGVTAKLALAQKLSRCGQVAPVILWLDTDRVGSDKHSMGAGWPGRQGSARLAPHRLRSREARFVPVRRTDVDAAFAQLATWIDETVTGPASARALRRLQDLSEEVQASHLGSLADLTYRLSMRILRDHLGVELPAARISSLLDAELLREPLEHVLTHVDAFVAVFNRAVEQLRSADVDPQVHLLPADYLPLHYSCPRDGRRLRLWHRRRASDHFAVTECACGGAYRFHLGRRRLNLDELAATGRWSTDVTLPVYLDGLASGTVAGRSSALYGLVLNRVLEEVFGVGPVPMLVPAMQVGGSDGGLVYEFLTAPEQG